MPAPVAATSRVLRNGIPVTDWSADRRSVELNTSIQSSFIGLSLLSLAIGMVSAHLEARSLVASRVDPQQVVLHAKVPAGQHSFLSSISRNHLCETVESNSQGERSVR